MTDKIESVSEKEVEVVSESVKTLNKISDKVMLKMFTSKIKGTTDELLLYIYFQTLEELERRGIEVSSTTQEQI